MDEILKLNAQVFAAANLVESETVESLKVNIDDVSDETIAESTGVSVEQVSEEKVKIKEMMKAIAFSTDPIMYVMLTKLNKSLRSNIISDMIEAINFSAISGLTGEQFELKNGKIVYVSLRPMRDNESSDQQFRQLPPLVDKNTFEYITKTGLKLLGQFYHKYTNFYQVNKARLASEAITENTFIASIDQTNATIVFGCPSIWFRVGVNIGIDTKSGTDIDTWVDLYA
jgi:hypothetical protein